MHILAIGGSNSANSINRQLAQFAASLFENSTVTIYDLSKIDIPLFSVQLENEIGMQPAARYFANEIDQSDLIVISLAENNGSYNAGFKNLIDWTSRLKDRKVWNDKPMLLMATSPGGRGGATVLETAVAYFPRMGADIKGSFTLPKFYENFDPIEGIIDQELLHELETVVRKIGDK
ncbi:MAG: NAD(P)H-dependent oxidoreductase [Flavobacteriales bacterium]|nr:NAD(P)H-dependent oxidoreductase [Flavobacteriales bacterium]